MIVHCGRQTEKCTLGLQGVLSFAKITHCFAVSVGQVAREAMFIETQRIGTAWPTPPSPLRSNSLDGNGRQRKVFALIHSLNRKRGGEMSEYNGAGADCSKRSHYD